MYYINIYIIFTIIIFISKLKRFLLIPKLGTSVSNTILYKKNLKKYIGIKILKIIKLANK